MDYSNSKLVHISIDDFELALKDITDNEDTYNSIFDNFTIRQLKTLHEKYGLKVSCFCFENNEFDISRTTNKFKKEFKENSGWLKFGFHAENYNSKYDMNTIEEANSFMTSFINSKSAICNFAGKESFCDIYRIHFYKCSKLCKDELINLGCKGLLSADDTRISYDLTNEENNQILKAGVYHKGLYYYQTNIRYESENDIISKLDSLRDKNTLILFTHESCINENFEKIQKSLEWLNENGYKYV